MLHIVSASGKAEVEPLSKIQNGSRVQADVLSTFGERKPGN